jgi:peptidoglycan/xylan/chitin deacetylase (PgdA/CDA1 family)
MEKIQRLPSFVQKRRLKTTTQRTMEKVEWPEGIRCPVCLSFDFDAQIGIVSLGYGDRLNQITEGEFGGRVGIWRILDLLDKYDVKATFFVPGWTAESYPEAVEEIDNRGHEVAHHGYNHLWSSELTIEDEKIEIESGIDALKRLTGKKPQGYRAPDAIYGQNTIDLLLKYGFTYDSTCSSDDIPYWWVVDGKEVPLLEIPSFWHLDDFQAYAVMLSPPGQKRPPMIPSELLKVWTSEFDGLYELGRCCTLICHPFLSGRPSRIKAIEDFIRHARSFPNVWFTRFIDVAEYWRRKYPPTKEFEENL